MSVINKTTKGKNDRMELAATENAKVCASVRIRYLAVESTRPAVRFRGRPRREAGGDGLATSGMGGVVTAFDSSILAEGWAVRNPG
jgi:hypothetical protein